MIYECEGCLEERTPLAFARLIAGGRKTWHDLRRRRALHDFVFEREPDCKGRSRCAPARTRTAQSNNDRSGK